MYNKILTVEKNLTYSVRVIVDKHSSQFSFKNISAFLLKHTIILCKVMYKRHGQV